MTNYYQPEIETAPRETIRALQSDKEGGQEERY